LEIQAEVLHRLLERNQFLRQIKESELEDKENVDPNLSKYLIIDVKLIKQ